ncbi:AMP-binding protein [Aeromicrobium ginsengisoli]|uniref:Propionyl-CoA synthetase n=1 Tax=Aeromicrobium ginsengisoli TaxID=363867 RepID=A0A5M4FFK1_9ACTN|nr:AMP-binding protein [Aeromicrobium ginsengisoli]KAA1398074.1 propionyl-CoA synthetase [Aeromicrobium ginsengisoli]
MASLIYRVLDEHVIHGLADNLAIEDERGTMSYAELLHESASVAGAFTNIGIVAGTGVQLDVPQGRELVVAVLALARLGAVPHGDAELRLVGVPPVLHTPDTEVTWDLLIHAGRMDPAQAPATDPKGYEALMREAYPDIFQALEAGETVT